MAGLAPPCPAPHPAVGGDVVIGSSARGRQRSLTVHGRLNVKLDALCEWSAGWRRPSAPNQEDACLAGPGVLTHTAQWH